MRAAENVVKAYASRSKAGDWAGWAESNPDQAALLAWAYLARGDVLSVESNGG